MADMNQLGGGAHQLVGITPWHCVICSSNFSQKSSLQRHMKMHVEQSESYHCPEDNCIYHTDRRSDLLRHHRAHLKQAYMSRSQSLGKTISSYQNKISTSRNNPLQINNPMTSTTSNLQNDQIIPAHQTVGTQNYEVGQYNSVNLEEFNLMMGALQNIPAASNDIINDNLPVNLTTKSTTVAIYQPTGNIIDNDDIQVDEGSSEDQSSMIPDNTVEIIASTENTDYMVTSAEDNEITETLSTPRAATTDNTPSDTPSPLEFCEGQVYVLNSSMQYVRVHAKIGDKFIITSKGLEKMEEEDPSTNLQVLTVKGKFTFTFDNK
jgi:hypothetical protein